MTEPAQDLETRERCKKTEVEEAFQTNFDEGLMQGRIIKTEVEVKSTDCLESWIVRIKH